MMRSHHFLSSFQSGVAFDCIAGAAAG